MEATRTIKNAPRRNMHPTSGVFVERINRIVLLFQDGTSLPPHSKSFKKQRFSTIWTSDTVFGPTRTASVSIADPNATLSFPNVTKLVTQCDTDTGETAGMVPKPWRSVAICQVLRTGSLLW